MGQSWALIIAPIGAVIAALVGVLVGGMVTRRAHRQERSQQEQSDACDQFDSASAKIVVELAALSGHHSAPGSQGVEPAIDWSAWQAALAKVNKGVAKTIVAQAHTVDEQIWRAHCEIQAGLTSWDDWFVLRERIELRRLEFINAVRQTVGLEALDSLSGRPPMHDPIWNLGRNEAADTGPQQLSPAPREEAPAQEASTKPPALCEGHNEERQPSGRQP
ncbi:hypothetical protein [Nonomuraea maheshkhaliensis]